MCGVGSVGVVGGPAAAEGVAAAEQLLIEGFTLCFRTIVTQMYALLDTTVSAGGLTS